MFVSLFASLVLAIFGIISFGGFSPGLIIVVFLLCALRIVTLRRFGVDCFIRQFVSYYVETTVYVFIFFRNSVLMGPLEILAPAPQLPAIIVHLILAAVLLGSCFFGRNRTTEAVWYEEVQIKWPRWTAFGVFIFYSVVIYFSWTMNIGVMGGEEVALPFKMAGIMTTSRMMIPALSFIFIIPLYRKNKVLFVFWWLMYLYVVVMDAIVMRSKGISIAFIVPYLLYLIFFAKIRKLMKFILILILTFTALTFFTFVNWVRSSDVNLQDFMRDSVSMASWRQDVVEGANIAAPFLRVSLSPVHLSKFYHFESGRLGSDYDKISDYGSASMYHTFAIDNFPLTARTSSGASGLGGWYLYLGAMGVLVGGALVCVLTYYADESEFLRKTPQLRILTLLLIMRMLLMDDTADYFLIPTILNYLSLLFLILLVFKARLCVGWLYRKAPSGLQNIRV